MIPRMEAVPALHPRGETPPLAAARLRRQLTVESAAKLARLTPEELTWLEEGKLYRFPSGDSAALALLLYATGLGISRREARRLAGLPILARPRREQVRQIAAMLIGAMAYRIERVTRADRFDYTQTAVYFHPGGERLAERLAGQLKVAARPLPGAGDASRLVVVVGPARL